MKKSILVIFCILFMCGCSGRITTEGSKYDRSEELKKVDVETSASQQKTAFIPASSEASEDSSVAEPLVLSISLLNNEELSTESKKGQIRTIFFDNIKYVGEYIMSTRTGDGPQITDEYTCKDI